MSTTTINYTAIDGTETGVLVLADIKAQIQNAQTDMQLRPVNAGNEAISGLWSFSNKITLDGAAAATGWLGIVHAGFMGGHTADNSLLVLSAGDYTNTIFRPYSDGVAVPTDDFQYEHDTDMWAFLGKLQVGGILDLNGAIELAGQAISGTAAVSGIWTHSVEIDMHGTGTANKFFEVKSLTSATGEGIAFHHDTSGDNFRFAPFNATNAYNSAWANTRSLHWDFPTDEWQIGDNDIWHYGNFPMLVTTPSTGQVLKYDGAKWTNQAASSGGIIDFKVVDNDGTTVTITDGLYLKFVAGNGINIDFTDTTPGSSIDPFDLDISVGVTVISGQTAITTGVLATDELLLNDGGVLKKMAMSVLSTYLAVPVGALEDGDFTVSGMMVRTGAGTYTTRTIAASSGLSISNGSGVSGDPSLTANFDTLTAMATAIVPASDYLVAIDANLSRKILFDDIIKNLTDSTTSASTDEIWLSDAGFARKIDLNDVKHVGGVVGSKFYIQTAAPTGMVSGDIWIDIN